MPTKLVLTSSQPSFSEPLLPTVYVDRHSSLVSTPVPIQPSRIQRWLLKSHDIRGQRSRKQIYKCNAFSIYISNTIIPDTCFGYIDVYFDAENKLVKDDLSSHMLNWYPNTLCIADEALSHPWLRGEPFACCNEKLPKHSQSTEEFQENRRQQASNLSR